MSQEQPPVGGRGKQVFNHGLWPHHEAYLAAKAAWAEKNGVAPRAECTTLSIASNNELTSDTFRRLLKGVSETYGRDGENKTIITGTGPITPRLWALEIIERVVGVAPGTLGGPITVPQPGLGITDENLIADVSSDVGHVPMVGLIYQSQGRTNDRPDFKARILEVNPEENRVIVLILGLGEKHWTLAEASHKLSPKPVEEHVKPSKTVKTGVMPNDFDEDAAPAPTEQAPELETPVMADEPAETIEPPATPEPIDEPLPTPADMAKQGEILDEPPVGLTGFHMLLPGMVKKLHELTFISELAFPAWMVLTDIPAWVYQSVQRDEVHVRLGYTDAITVPITLWQSFKTQKMDIEQAYIRIAFKGLATLKAKNEELTKKVGTKKAQEVLLPMREKASELNQLLRTELAQIITELGDLDIGHDTLDPESLKPILAQAKALRRKALVILTPLTK